MSWPLSSEHITEASFLALLKAPSNHRVALVVFGSNSNHNQFVVERWEKELSQLGSCVSFQLCQASNLSHMRRKIKPSTKFVILNLVWTSNLVRRIPTTWLRSAKVQTIATVYVDTHPDANIEECLAQGLDLATQEATAVFNHTARLLLSLNKNSTDGTDYFAHIGS